MYLWEIQKVKPIVETQRKNTCEKKFMFLCLLGTLVQLKSDFKTLRLVVLNSISYLSCRSDTFRSKFERTKRDDSNICEAVINRALGEVGLSCVVNGERNKLHPTWGNPNTSTGIIQPLALISTEEACITSSHDKDFTLASAAEYVFN